MIEQFRDGVFFVALAPITDSGLVASTIAKSLGFPETPGRSIVDSLKEYLKFKALLLLLDNFEQVIAAAPLVADLLIACTGLKILVTSREGLHISGESEYPVPPLELPALSQLPSLESLTRFAAVELFIQRAKAVKPISGYERNSSGGCRNLLSVGRFAAGDRVGGGAHQVIAAAGHARPPRTSTGIFDGRRTQSASAPANTA
jgi:hypothetical protein